MFANSPLDKIKIFLYFKHTFPFPARVAGKAKKNTNSNKILL